MSRYASAVDDDVAMGVNTGIAVISADTGITVLNSAVSTGDQPANSTISTVLLALAVDGQSVAAGDGDEV